MTQPPQKEIMDVLVANEAASRNFFQNFEYNHHTITHQHRIQVQMSAVKGQQLQISNHFALIKDNKVFKLTEIQLQNRIIKIIDTFTTVNTSQTTTTPQQSESVREAEKQNSRRQILNKKYFGNFQNENQNSDNKHRDTKNLVKNTIRLFQTWLEENMEVGGEVYRLLAEFTKNGKFNNNLIISISKNAVLRRAFLSFCQTNAEDFIHKSKIHDKSSHAQALKKYQNLCVEEDDLEQEEAEKMDSPHRGSMRDDEREEILQEE